MRCVPCWVNERVDTEAVAIVAGFSTCEAHIDAALVRESKKYSSTWFETGSVAWPQ